jgi:hypothetical protein
LENIAGPVFNMEVLGHRAIYLRCRGDIGQNLAILFRTGYKGDEHTYKNVDFVGIHAAGCIRGRAGQIITCRVRELLRGLDARDISNGTENALAIPLEREQWETPAASSYGALIHSDSRATVQALRQGSAQVRPTSIVVAALVPVGGTCSFKIMCKNQSPSHMRCAEPDGKSRCRLLEKIGIAS